MESKYRIRNTKEIHSIDPLASDYLEVRKGHKGVRISLKNKNNCETTFFIDITIEQAKVLGKILTEELQNL